MKRIDTGDKEQNVFVSIFSWLRPVKSPGLPGHLAAAYTKGFDKNSNLQEI